MAIIIPSSDIQQLTPGDLVTLVMGNVYRIYTFKPFIPENALKPNSAYGSRWMKSGDYRPLVVEGAMLLVTPAKDKRHLLTRYDAEWPIIHKSLTNRYRYQARVVTSVDPSYAAWPLHGIRLQRDNYPEHLESFISRAPEHKATVEVAPKIKCSACDGSGYSGRRDRLGEMQDCPVCDGVGGA